VVHDITKEQIHPSVWNKNMWWSRSGSSGIWWNLAADTGHHDYMLWWCLSIWCFIFLECLYPTNLLSQKVLVSLVEAQMQLHKRVLSVAGYFCHPRMIDYENLLEQISLCLLLYCKRNSLMSSLVWCQILSDHSSSNDAPCLLGFPGKVFKIVGNVQYEVSKSLDLYVSSSNSFFPCLLLLVLCKNLRYLIPGNDNSLEL
jgi:hypothetical protein